MLRDCRIPLFLSGVLVLTSGAFAQSTEPPKPLTTFKTGVSNVVVDVVVTGRNGAPIEGLARDSFSVLENGHAQPIVAFEAHPSSLPATPAAARKTPVGVYTNQAAASENDTLDVLLIDALNTPTEKQAQSHTILVSFLKTLPVHKPIAIFILDTQLRLLEDFTTDHTALLHAVQEFTAVPHKSPLLKTTQETAAQLEQEDEKIEFALALKPGLQAIGEQQALKLREFYANQDSFKDSLRVGYTLAAFDQLGRYLSGMPGRKNVLWLSGSFPLAILPNPDIKTSFDASRDFTAQIDHTASVLASARVALYPIDARGILSQSLSSAAVSGGSAVRSVERNSQAESEEFSARAEEQMAQEEVARATGGRAIYNTNDLQSALAELDRDGSHFYTLVYASTDKAEDNRLRRIEVRVHPGKYHLSYRRTYAPVEWSRQATNFALLMQHNTVASKQLPFRVSPVLIAAQPESAPLVGSNPNVRRPVVRYAIEYDVDVAGLVLSAAADGLLHGGASLLTIAYDRDGKPLNSVSNALNIHVPPGQYAHFMQQGIQYRQQLDIPSQAVWLRAGVFEPASGRAGTLELPVAVALEGAK